MQTHLETFTTPDGKWTITIEVDWKGETLSTVIEENDIDNVEQIYE